MTRLLLAAALVLGTTAASHAADPYVIGVIAPTTGPVATVGSRQLKTAEWWQQDVNARGGINGRKIQIAHCNDEASPEKAVTCARDLIAKGAVVLMNFSITGPILATMPLVKNGPVMLTPSPNVSPAASTFVFQTSPTDYQMTEAIAAYLKKNHIKKIGMIAATDTSGEVGVHSATKVFPANGIDARISRIDLRANDASVQLANVATSDRKLIYCSYSGGGAIAVVKSFANFGLKQPLLVSYANVSSAFVKVIKNDLPHRLMGIALKGLAPQLLSDASERAHIKEFAASYHKATGDTIDELSLNGLGVVDITAAILNNVKDPKDPEAVRKFLRSGPIKSFETFHFNASNNVGLGRDDVAIVEYKNGDWIPAQPIK